MFRFENPYLLYLLIIVPILLIFKYFINLKKTKQINIIGSPDTIIKLLPNFSVTFANLKFYLILLSIFFLIIGLANPQIGSKMEKIKRKGADIVIALDVSNSMLTEDIKPSRLTRARQAISKLIDELDNDRIGIIVFAGKAYTQLPLTPDYGAAKLFISTITTDMIPVQGTAIGAAIEMAEYSFKKDQLKNKAIIIITDGENHEDDAIATAKKAKESNIIVSTIGMGLAEGGPIPVNKNGINVGFKKDRDGNTVISKLDENLLKQIAIAGGGSYVRASNSNVGLSTIYTDIKNLEKAEYDTKLFSEYENRYYYFFILAFIFLLIELLLNTKRTNFFKDFKFFSNSNFFNS